MSKKIGIEEVTCWIENMEQFKYCGLSVMSLTDRVVWLYRHHVIDKQTYNDRIDRLYEIIKCGYYDV